MRNRRYVFFTIYLFPLKNVLFQNSRVHLLDTESFKYTFGPKAQRKRPNLKLPDLETLVESATTKADSYNPESDRDLVNQDELDSGVRDEAREPMFQKGQSKRIWNELYKVLDSSDVVIEVLDARDPMGTRCRRVEQFLRKEKPHKHLILLLNKVDLIPTWVTVSDLRFFLEVLWESILELGLLGGLGVFRGFLPRIKAISRINLFLFSLYSKNG